MALSEVIQNSFAGGIFRGRRGPANAVYDAVNLILDEESQLVRRGGSSFFTSADPAFTLGGLADVYLPPGARTLVWGTSASDDLYALDESAPAFRNISNSSGDFNPVPFSRVVGAGSVVALVEGTSPLAEILLYGGSLKTADYTTGTVAVTNGSKTVTGTSTAFLANVDRGMFLRTGSGSAIVASVDSDTQVTLLDPWQGSTGSGIASNFRRLEGKTFITVQYGIQTMSLAAVGTSPRLFVVFGTRAYYFPAGNPLGSINLATDFIDVPAASLLIGANSIADTLVLFATDGVWAVSNLDSDPVDDFGNISWAQRQISKDLILWGDAGVAGWNGQLIVPAVDDVYLLALDGSAVPLTDSIRPLYRGYVKAGYQPGTAVVHRATYMLPILNGTSLVDVLVCRLDRPYRGPRGELVFPFTRWSGYAAGGAYAQRVGSTTRAPKLLGIKGSRVTDLTGCFDPTSSNAVDADGTAYSCTIESRDFPTSPGSQPGFVNRVRARYVLTEVSSTDNFNRANGGLGSNWTTDPFDASSGAPSIVSNQATATIASSLPAEAWWNASNVTVPMRVGLTVQARPAANGSSKWSEVGFVENPGGALSFGYALGLMYGTAADQAVIERVDFFNTRTTIATATFGSRIAAGDTIELAIGDDGAISALVNGASVATATDTTYFQAGEAASPVMGLNDANGASSIRHDDFYFVASPTVAVAVSSDQDDGVYSDLTDKGEQNGGTGWGTSDGSLYNWGRASKRRDRLRVRLTVTGAAASFVLREMRLLIRPQGRQ